VNRINGTMIVELRRSRGWDQKTLANVSGVDAGVISRLERNLQSDFKISVVLAVAKALEVSVDTLLNYVPSEDDVVTPEWEVICAAIAKYPPRIQKQAAAIMQGYLSSLREDADLQLPE
jgi:transcriptional regulator with XRE-family HTH domain